MCYITIIKLIQKKIIGKINLLKQIIILLNFSEFWVVGANLKKVVLIMSFNFWKNFNSEDDIHRSQPLFLKRRKKTH
jgi:hypothetical protein